MAAWMSSNCCVRPGYLRNNRCRCSDVSSARKGLAGSDRVTGELLMSGSGFSGFAISCGSGSGG